MQILSTCSIQIVLGKDSIVTWIALYSETTIAQIILTIITLFKSLDEYHKSTCSNQP